MRDYDNVDFFTDPALLVDPYEYFEHLRAKCPITGLPERGVLAVSGYEEATEIYRDADTFSSCNSVAGPFATFPEPLEGDDISELIARYRDQLPLNEHLVTMDAPVHTRERALLMRLLTPKRLKENEDFMRRLADRMLDELLTGGPHEFISAYAQPFALLVVADVLGVPEEHHETFRRWFGLSNQQIRESDDAMLPLNPLEELGGWFTTYIEDRRREPRDDVLSALALATYPDGSIPEVRSVVHIATLLFAAGQETTARLLATGMKFLAERPELQAELRAHRDRIPNFIEEVLRIESPVKSDFRLARRAAQVGGVDIAPGTPVMLLNGAANRDPRRFECPAELQIDRPNVKEHLTFGRGAHACPGAPLARAEARISFERILDRTSDIRLSEEHHGPPGDRRFSYEPTWLLRGLSTLHIELEPATTG